jgi:hypothetical protein
LWCVKESGLELTLTLATIAPITGGLQFRRLD